MTTKRRMNPGIFASAIIAGALAATGAWAQQSSTEAVQVSGAELQAWLSNGFVYAAEDHMVVGSVFFVMGPANDRRLFYYINESSPTNSFKGTQRVVGDTLCATWPFNARGEQCREWYRVGENRYEAREKGSRTKSATLYIVRSHKP
jgi:hypothetical protein